jgi:long-chain acyl-CoA synthetase
VLTRVAQGALNISPEQEGSIRLRSFSLLRAHRGVTMFAAPTMVKRLVDAAGDVETRHLKTIVYGGGPMYLEQCRHALQLFDGKLAQITVRLKPR